jgi:hypothetical protein
MPSPSPTVATASPTTIPTVPPPYALDCGPLAAVESDCAAAVEAALRLLSLAPEDVSAVRVLPPGPACSPGTPGLICRRPTVIVRVFGNSRTVTVYEVSLLRTTTGWISAAQIR